MYFVLSSLLRILSIVKPRRTSEPSMLDQRQLRYHRIFGGITLLA